MADFEATLQADSAGEEMLAEFHSSEILSMVLDENGHLIITLIGGKILDAGKLPGTVPVRGVDYWTEEDIASIKAYVDEAILGGAW